MANSMVREIAPDMKATLCAYNGSSPGPTIEVVEGDKVCIFVTNKLVGSHHRCRHRPDARDQVRCHGTGRLDLLLPRKFTTVKVRREQKAGDYKDPCW